MMFLLVFGGLALYVMTSEERLRLLHYARIAAQESMRWAYRARADAGSFGAALRARTPLLIVTPAIVAANLAIFVCVVGADGAASDEATLIAWGASVGPSTTNGEWWRLATATFVHGSLLALLIHTAAIAQLGLVLERLIGHFAFAAIYLAAGIFASVMNLAASPETVTAGASGAVFGMYGLLAASIVRGTLQPSNLTIPLRALAVLAPVGSVFALYGGLGSGFDPAARAGMLTGFLFGIVVERGVREHKPRAQRLAAVSAATLAIAVLTAVPLRGFTDVKPEIALVVALEERTAADYESAVLRFRKGHVTTKALAQLIDGSILPEIRAAHTRVKALQRVPAAHKAVVAAADRYLTLREESWRVRAQALNTASMRLLRDADAKERAALSAFGPVRQSPLEGPAQ